jgi:hypothetical protein
MPAPDNLTHALAIAAIVIALLSLAVSFQAKRQAKKAALLTALLGPRREGIIHIRHAFNDVSLHDRIGAETVTSIREALQLPPLVFSRTVSDMLDDAYKIAFRLQGRSSEQRTEQQDLDRDALEKQLENILSAMNKEAALKL